MPESEPKPRLIELVAPGAGQGWKAVLKSGKPAVVHEIPMPPAEAAASVPRMQRLFEHRHPALSPVLAWGIEHNGLWVAVEPNEGTPLGSILARGPLTPPAAAALGAAVLSGVAALHEAGIAMGGFGATAVRVTSNGDVRLAGHPAAAVRGAPSQSDLRADVRSSGMAVCAAFGVDPAGAPAPARPLQTYPAMPAITSPPAAPAPPAPTAPPQAENQPSPPPVPTWSDEPYQPPAASVTTPPAPAPVEPAAEPAPEPEAPPPSAFASPPPAPSWTTSAPEPAATPAEPGAPARPPTQPTRTPMEHPVWKPGEAVPPQPLGTGVAAAAIPPPLMEPPPAQAPVRPPSAPARRPIPRPKSGGGPPSERRPWLIPVAIAAVIVILLGIVGVIILANRGSGPVTGVRTSPSASAKPTTPPSGSPR